MYNSKFCKEIVSKRRETIDYELFELYGYWMQIDNDLMLFPLNIHIIDVFLLSNKRNDDISHCIDNAPKSLTIWTQIKAMVWHILCQIAQ